MRARVRIPHCCSLSGEIKKRRIKRRLESFLEKNLVLCSGLHRFGCDVHPAAFTVELHLPINESEKSPIASGADVMASHEFSSALADDDAAGCYMLSAKGFHAEALAITVTAVAAAALAFLVCHTIKTTFLRSPK